MHEWFRSGAHRENFHPNETLRHEKSEALGQGTPERATSLCANQTFEI